MDPKVNEAKISLINEWHDNYANKTSKLLDPSDERLALIDEKNDQLEVYAFKLTRFDGCFKKLEEYEPTTIDVRAQISLIDMSYKQFFGKTWMGPFKRLKVNKSGGNGPVGTLDYDETVFFSTRIFDEHILYIIELVAKINNKLISIGWSAFRPFSRSTDEAKSSRLGVYYGTPRAMLFIDEPFEKCKHLKEITGLYINYSFSPKPKLTDLSNYIPENVLLGRNDRLGGIVEDPLAKNILDRPRLSNQMSFIIDDLFIYLYPNVTKFEADMCKLISEDKSTWNKIDIEPSVVTVFERRLKIGIHNGWKFVSQPYIIHLSIDEQLTSTKQHFQQQLSNTIQQQLKAKRLSLKSSIKPPKATDSEMDNSNQPKRLFMRNSVILNEIFEDPLCTIVFEIEYVLNIPIQVNIMNTLNKKNISETKKQYETHHVTVRWGTYSPFSSRNNDNQFKSNIDDITSRVELNMFGNDLAHYYDNPNNNISYLNYNPQRRLIFKCPDTNMQDKQSSQTANGKIIFDMKRGNQLTFKQPRFDEDYEQTNHMQTQQTTLQIPNDMMDTKSPRFGMTEQYSYRSRSGQMDSARQYMSDLQRKSIMDIYGQMLPADPNVQSAQGNLLMNQLVSRASDSQRLVGLFGGNLELYPIYNPSLHLPILALNPGQMGGRTMSRAAYAKLQSANFSPILDRFGKIADVIDGNSYIQFDLQREEADMLSCNHIVIQFLAFSRTLTAARSGKSEGRPSSVFFTFQFYRFPEFKTPRLVLDRPIEDYSFDSESTPFILKQVDEHPNHSNNASQLSPGYMISYSVDPTNLKFGEKKLFLQYLAQHSMFIDVWDGDSLHLIGTATLQLKELLRQGKEAVQCTYELDILSTEYDDDTVTNSGTMLREGVPYSCDSHIKMQGLLHLRVGNVGSPVGDINESDLCPTPIAPALPFTRVVASKSSLNAFGENLLTRKIDEATARGYITHNISKAHHMTETFKDIHAALVSSTTSNKNISDANDDYNNLDPRRKRKLLKMQLVRSRLEQNENIPPQITTIGNHRRIIQERDKDLRIMKFYRDQTKHDQILNKLHEFITTEYAIYPNFGIAEFFEFVITNPYNEPQTITILSDDPELQVVTNSKEWRHLKLLNQIYSQVEDNMFHREIVNSARDPKSAVAAMNENQLDLIRYPQIYLRPKETINIPLKFQTFRAHSHPTITVAGQQPNDVPSNDPNTMNVLKATESSVIRHVKNTYDIRKAMVHFRAQDGNPIAILRLIIDQQPHVVNQTIRYYECEHSFLKRVIRLPSSTITMASPPLQSISQSQTHTQQMVNSDVRIDGTTVERGTSQLFVRSSDPNVVCESRAVNIGEPHDVFVKVATGPSPSVKCFFLAIYADQYLSVPLQIWQIYVHSLNRIDVSCELGQTSRFSLILKGTQSSRLVRCYPSSPEEMSVVPTDKFMLASSSVQEINVGIQPSKSGAKHYYLNVVDIEMSQLVHSWFINANCKPPVITKSFEITLPLATSSTGTLNTAHKRVSYTNPYSTERVFIFSTNRDDLLTFKERRIKFLANETKTIGLKLLPNSLIGFVEILVFINNDGNDTNEETFSLRVHYVKQ